MAASVDARIIEGHDAYRRGDAEMAREIFERVARERSLGRSSRDWRRRATSVRTTPARWASMSALTWRTDVRVTFWVLPARPT
jgi:hypothetical protein